MKKSKKLKNVYLKLIYIFSKNNLGCISSAGFFDFSFRRFSFRRFLFRRNLFPLFFIGWKTYESHGDHPGYSDNFFQKPYEGKKKDSKRHHCISRQYYIATHMWQTLQEVFVHSYNRFHM